MEDGDDDDDRAPAASVVAADPARDADGGRRFERPAHDESHCAVCQGFLNHRTARMIDAAPPGILKIETPLYAIPVAHVVVRGPVIIHESVARGPPEPSC